MNGCFLRGIAAWLVIILAESVHGAFRTIFLQPLMGDLQARQVSVLSGAVLIFVIAYAFSDWVMAKTIYQQLAVGTMWVLLTVCFEVLLGRLILEYSWERIFQDYRITEGGFLGFGLLFMALTPTLAARLRGLAVAWKGVMHAKHN